MKIDEFLKNKDVLVTGGCGSIGTEIVQQLIKHPVKRVRIFDHNESGQFFLQKKLGHRGQKKTRTLIGDIRDKERLRLAIKGVDIVFHSAALKHVSICEYNPFEAVATNIYGTQSLIDVAREEGVKRFINISTDKAVNPINTMGATKLLSEKLILNAGLGDYKTKFSCVRFGNVLNSDGSVVPIFKEQIATGGPVTLTSKNMIRFFMSISDAVKLVLEAVKIMEGREIFILKMQAMRISDLAEAMIEELASKYGYVPDKIKIKIVGPRNGEKIYENLMTEEEAQYAEEKNNMFVLKSQIITPQYIEKPRKKSFVSEKEYKSKYAKLLSKKEIKKYFTKKTLDKFNII
jgi:UDP-N-acetylglucosamine 4,6-dehydratase/5-epimerase